MILFIITLLFMGDDLPTRYPAAERIVAIGDVHGDADATRRALRLAGAIDARDQWVGGNLVLVQTGDQLDRGDDEQEILDLFAALRKEAAAAGGLFLPLNGNHELMNAKGDLRYVTPGGMDDFGMPEGSDLESLDKFPPEQRARAAAFRPGSPYALQLAQRNVVVIVGDSVFVHGGVLPAQVDYGLERINKEVRSWLRGERSRPESYRDLVWTRLFSDEPDASACEILGEVLSGLGIKRMVVGHTVQKKGIRSYCDDRVWCIDVGMSAHYGGKPAVLEIKGDEVRILKE